MTTARKYDDAALDAMAGEAHDLVKLAVEASKRLEELRVEQIETARRRRALWLAATKQDPRPTHAKIAAACGQCQAYVANELGTARAEHEAGYRLDVASVS